MSVSSVAAPVHRWWIDGLLVALGAAAITRGWYVPGAIAIVVGLSFPLVHALGVRGQATVRALRFAPDELADRHHRIRALAERLPHDVHAGGALEAADDVVLEAAAIFAGRPVHGAIHRRYVRQRSELLDRLAMDLTERATALAAARAEVEALDLHRDDVAEPAPRPSDALATLLLWVLAPLFIAWELGGLAARGLVVLVEGVILRLRTVASLLARGVVAVGRTVAAAVRRWRDVRVRFVASTQEARRQFVAARFRLRMRLRRSGRPA